MHKNAIIGVGNLLFCDDGFGIIAIAYLKSNFSFFPELELLDGGAMGFNLLEYFVEYDNVYILDTISLKDNVGEIYKIPSEELLGSGGYKNTAHEVEVVSMLEASELYEKKASTTIFAIVPQNIQRVEIGLSQDVQKRFDSFIGVVIDAIKALRVEVERVNDISLEQVIEELKREGEQKCNIL